MNGMNGQGPLEKDKNTFIVDWADDAFVEVVDFDGAADASAFKGAFLKLEAQLAKFQAALSASAQKVFPSEVGFLKLALKTAELKAMLRALRVAAAEKALLELESELAELKIIAKASDLRAKASQAEVRRLEAEKDGLETALEASSLRANAAEVELEKLKADLTVLRALEQPLARSFAASEAPSVVLEAKVAESKAADEASGGKGAAAKVELQQRDEPTVKAERVVQTSSEEDQRGDTESEPKGRWNRAFEMYQKVMSIRRERLALRKDAEEETSSKISSERLTSKEAGERVSKVYHMYESLRRGRNTLRYKLDQSEELRRKLEAIKSAWLEGDEIDFADLESFMQLFNNLPNGS